MVSQNGVEVARTKSVDPLKSLLPQFPEVEIVQLVNGQLVSSVLLKKTSHVVKPEIGVTA